MIVCPLFCCCQLFKGNVLRSGIPQVRQQLLGEDHPPLIEQDKLSADKAAAIIPHGTKHISAVGRSSGLAPREMAAFNNKIQRFLIENTSRGIPAIIHAECLNGFMAKGATIFPQNIGLTSTWDPNLIGRSAGVVRQLMRSPVFTRDSPLCWMSPGTRDGEE
jgi:beta-glucosidase-like glycosyl hydrolase